MKLIYKYILLTAIWLLVSTPICHAGDTDTKVSKTIVEGFLMPKNGHLEITNKYGQILINNSDSDSLIVKVQIIAYGKDRSTATKILNRVDFDFVQTNQYLTLETILDRKSGAFKELWNSIGDYSKTLLSKNKLEINYEVSVPNSISVSLTNKFGDIFMADRYQKVDVELSHGNLRAQNFNAHSSISVSYGKAHLKNFKDGNLTFKASEVTIRSIESANIRSSSSEITITKAEDVSLESRSDKFIEFTEVERLKGKMSLSKLKIDELSKNLNIDLKYSDIIINHIAFNFSLIRIEGRYSDIDLEFDPLTYMEVDIKADEDRFQLPFADLNKEYVDEKKGIARYSGTIGKKNNYKGSLNIDSESGEINIKFKSQQQSVNSNN